MSYITDLENELWFRGRPTNIHYSDADRYQNNGFSVDDAAAHIIITQRNEEQARRWRNEEQAYNELHEEAERIEQQRLDNAISDYENNMFDDLPF